MEIKFTSVNDGNVSIYTDASSDDSKNYHGQEMSIDLEISENDNTLTFNLDIKTHFEALNDVELNDVTFTLDNAQCKYLHSFLTTFLKLNPK